jgi:hypothetical protein
MVHSNVVNEGQLTRLGSAQRPATRSGEPIGGREGLLKSEAVAVLRGHSARTVAFCRRTKPSPAGREQPGQIFILTHTLLSHSDTGQT